jgi:hypothetical protein
MIALEVPPAGVSDPARLMGTESGHEAQLVNMRSADDVSGEYFVAE